MRCYCSEIALNALKLHRDYAGCTEMTPSALKLRCNLHLMHHNCSEIALSILKLEITPKPYCLQAAPKAL